MRRKRQSGADLVVNLFPFLAVLICTMGVLIVMLVMAVRSSQLRASDAQAQQQESIALRREQILDQLDLEQFRVSEIEAMRPDLRARLGQQRARRSHLEDEIRRLRETALDLQRQWDRADEDKTLAVESHDQQRAKIDALQSLLKRRQAELDEIRQRLAGRPLLYSIIPTESPGGTARRPIYVECRPDGIYLRPSGIRIPLESFTIPVVAGNPLDAALLATREYWNRFDAAGAQGDPYPLLVVRPGGAPAYAIARRSMNSWDDEFGYELVEDSRQIDWGSPEPELTRTLRQALEDAAARQQFLVATRQVQWLGDYEVDSNAAARKGSGNDGAGGPAARGATTTRGFGSGENRSGGYSYAGRPGGESKMPGDLGGSRPGRPGGLPNSGFSDHSHPVGLASDSAGAGQLQPAITGTGGSRFGSTGSGAGPDRSESPGGSPGNAANTNMAAGSPGTASNGNHPTGSPAATANGNRAAGSPGATPHGNLAVGSPAATGNQAGSAAGQAAGSGGSPGESPAESVPASLSHIVPLSETRGADWALPTRTQGATAYRRPIRIQCTGSGFEVHNSDPARPTVRVPLGATLDESVDGLIHQIWNQIEEWGMAEAGGYWKPVLRLSADEAGAIHAAELERKLHGSGIEIERPY